MDTQTQRLQKFIRLFSQVMDSDTAEDMAYELRDKGFFDAPASTKYHGNYPGGLFQHSYMVTLALLDLTDNLHLTWERPESPYLVGMLHDLCKTDQYVQKEDGTYEYAKNLPLTGHGDKSVILAQKLTFLTDEEVLCIRWHMGAYDEKENWNALGAAIEKYPNVLYTHTADMIASRIHGV